MQIQNRSSFDVAGAARSGPGRALRRTVAAGLLLVAGIAAWGALQKQFDSSFKAFAGCATTSVPSAGIATQTPAA